MHTSHNQVTALAELTSSQSQPAGIRATLVFIAISLFCAVTALPSPDFIQLVDSNLIIDEEEGVRLGPRWLFHEGDNSAWADPGFDDSDWTLRNSYVQASRDVLDEWTGIGWYRYHISIDSTVAGRPLGMRISHTGALEIFADGEYIASVGTVSASPEGEEVVVRYLAPPIRLVFEQPGEHVLAIRYSNHEEGQTYRWGWGIGFYANVAYYEHYLDHMLGELERAVTQQGFFTGIALGFALLHLLMFLFYPSIKENLFFAILALALAGLAFFPIEANLVQKLNSVVVYMILFKLSLVVTALFSPLILRSIFHESIPRHFWIPIGVSVVLALWSPLIPLIYYYAFAILSLIESLRIVALAVYRRKEFSWMIGLGFLVFVLTTAYQMAPEFVSLIREYYYVDFPYYLIGILALIVSFSIYLARSFATTNTRLQRKLVEVQELSEKTLEQERRAREEETARKLLEADLDRARELEKAHRALEQTNRELRETQSQLVQSEKMASLGSLVAGIAHELNTPIGAVGSMHNTLVRAVNNLQDMIRREGGLADQPAVQRSFTAIDEANKVIRSGADRVTTIVRRLRSFARLDEAELKTADIHEGLEDTLTLIHHEIKHEIEIIRNYGEVPPIACFPGQLNQVFLNLLNNARQAIKGKGTITITTGVKDHKVRIEIADSGQGIKPEHLDRIFDPGFTTKGVGVGTGLGLSICYRIIQQHRGTISVSSEVGSGTAFTIKLPMDLNKWVEKT